MKNWAMLCVIAFCVQAFGDIDQVEIVPGVTTNSVDNWQVVDWPTIGPCLNIKITKNNSAVMLFLKLDGSVTQEYKLATFLSWASAKKEKLLLQWDTSNLTISAFVIGGQIILN